MSSEHRRSSNDVQVREVLTRWAAAIHDRDADAASACLTPDVLTFDLAPPLQTAGRESIEKGLEEWFRTWDGPIGLEVRDLTIRADERVAWCTSLQRMSGTKGDGSQPGLWFRATTCLQKIDGVWRIAHEHTSTPFYMDGSDKAALDLKP